MTFILCCATRDAIYQISDRRLTYLDGPEIGQAKDNESNKAVVVDYRLAFAYTGLDTLDGQPTDEWLVRTAGDGQTNDLAEPVERIRYRAGIAIRKRYIAPRLRRLAFVGVGWTIPGPVQEIKPLLCVVSNALDSNGDWLPEGKREFSTQLNIWGKERGKFLIFAGGQPLMPQERYAIWRHLQQCIRAKRGHTLVIRALLNSMTFVADRHSSVGRSVQLVVLPRLATERLRQTGQSMLLTGGPPSDEHNSFFYLKPGGSLTSYGPHVAAGGGVLMNFTFSALPPAP